MGKMKEIANNDKIMEDAERAIELIEDGMKKSGIVKIPKTVNEAKEIAINHLYKMGLISETISPEMSFDEYREEMAKTMNLLHDFEYDDMYHFDSITSSIMDFDPYYADGKWPEKITPEDLKGKRAIYFSNEEAAKEIQPWLDKDTKIYVASDGFLETMEEADQIIKEIREKPTKKGYNRVKELIVSWNADRNDNDEEDNDNDGILWHRVN